MVWIRKISKCGDTGQFLYTFFCLFVFNSIRIGHHNLIIKNTLFLTYCFTLKIIGWHFEINFSFIYLDVKMFWNSRGINKRNNKKKISFLLQPYRKDEKDTKTANDRRRGAADCVRRTIICCTRSNLHWNFRIKHLYTASFSFFSFMSNPLLFLFQFDKFK